MTTLTADAYRRPFLDPQDELYRRCLVAASCIGAAVLVSFLFAPARRAAITHVEQLPPRFAKLILDPEAAKPAPPGLVPGPARRPDASAHPGGGGGGGSAGPLGLPAPVAAIPGGAGLRNRMPGPVSPGSGFAGRSRAQAEVATALASTSGSLSSALEGLSASLGSSTSDAPVAVGHGGRGRVIRAARTDAQLASVSAGIGGGSSADLGHSVVVGSLVATGDLAGLRGGGGGGSGGSGPGGGGGGSGGGYGGGIGTGYGDGVGPGAGGGSGGGSGGGNGTGVGTGSGPGGQRGAAAPGVYRSNASLLAVIQRYSAGIQYCYGNELKRDPTLHGKLVIAITVAASGEVLEANIVQNSVGSSRLAECALSQIREWRFPAIPVGVTAFQAPFVFTPPS